MKQLAALLSFAHGPRRVEFIEMFYTMRCLDVTAMAFRLSAIATAVAVLVTAATGAKATTQSTDLKTTCAARALAQFEELEREYGEVLQRINVPFEIKSSSYQAAYSGKIGRCLMLVRRTASVYRKWRDTSYLIDADTRRMYALYVETGGKVESCTLIPSVEATRTCKDRLEFDAFVRDYVELGGGRR